MDIQQRRAFLLRVIGGVLIVAGALLTLAAVWIEQSFHTPAKLFATALILGLTGFITVLVTT